MGIAAKAASRQLALLSSREKNQVLEKIADYLEAQTDDILPRQRGRFSRSSRQWPE